MKIFKYFLMSIMAHRNKSNPHPQCTIVLSENREADSLGTSREFNPLSDLDYKDFTPHQQVGWTQSPPPPTRQALPNGGQGFLLWNEEVSSTATSLNWARVISVVHNVPFVPESAVLLGEGRGKVTSILSRGAGAGTGNSRERRQQSKMALVLGIQAYICATRTTYSSAQGRTDFIYA